MHACARHGTWVAETLAGTVIAAGAGPLGDLWLHLRPCWRPVSPSGIEDHGGRAAPHAVEIQPKAARIHEPARPRVNDVRGRALADGWLLATDGACGEEHRQHDDLCSF